MNARQLIVILLVAVVLGAIGWVLFHRDVRSWENQPATPNQKVIDFPLNDVAHITIKDGTSEVNLVKKADGWVVRERADYPANFEQVSRFLQKVWNLKPVETIQLGPSQFARLELTAPAKETKSGTLLELKNKSDKRIAALLAGKQYLKKSNQNFGPASFPAGRYVMPEDGSGRVFLTSDPLLELVTKPERWLNRDFIKLEKPKSIALDGTAPAMKWKIGRENESADWKFAEAKPGEEVDQTKLSTLANSVSNMSFADVLDPNVKPDSIGLDKPSTVTIETFDGLAGTLKIGNPSGDKYPVTISMAAAPNEKTEDKKKIEEKLATEKKFEGRPFLINKFPIEQLLKNRADLVKAPPSPSPSPANPSSAPPLPNDQRAGKALHTPAPPGRP